MQRSIHASVSISEKGYNSYPFLLADTRFLTGPHPCGKLFHLEGHSILEMDLVGRMTKRPQHDLWVVTGEADEWARKMCPLRANLAHPFVPLEVPQCFRDGRFQF